MTKEQLQDILILRYTNEFLSISYWKDFDLNIFLLYILKHEWAEKCFFVIYFTYWYVELF